MCYDISYTSNVRELSDYFPGLIFDDQLVLDFQPFDHVQAPFVWAPHPIIFRNKTDNRLHCRLMEWGIVRHSDTDIPKLKDPEYGKKRNYMLNIQSERIFEEGTYWYIIRNKRCLIPVTGIFEHRHILGWTRKVPYWVRPADQPVFFLPGLYAVVVYIDKNTGEAFEPVSTFGLITTGANSVMQLIHNGSDRGFRMPLFMPFQISDRYISADLYEEEYREILKFKIPSEDLIYHPVHTIRTFKPRPDGKDKTQSFSWPGLPPLGEQNPY